MNRLLRAAIGVLTGIILVGVLAVTPGDPASAAGRRDTVPPTVPTNLRVTALSQTSVSLAWNPSTDNVRLLSYTAWAPGLPLNPVTAPQTTATFTGLRPNTSYVFRVQAWDGWNWSFPSNLLTVTTPRETVPPTAPGALRVADTLWGAPVDGVTASAVLLTWASSTDAFGPIRYDVLVNGVPTGDAFSTRTAGSPAGPSSGAWVRQLRPGTTYQLTVRARDGSGNVSASSNTVTVTTEPSSDTAAPTVPTLLSASSGGTSLCPEELWLRWSPSTDDRGTVEYEVRVNGTIIDVATGGTNWITYTEVPGANTVTLVAVDGAGNASAPSNAITETVNWGGDCAP